MISAGRALRVAAAAACLLPAPACSVLTHGCSAVDARGGVIVDLTGAVGTAAPGPLAVTTCVDGTCVVEHDVPAEAPWVGADLPLDEDSTVAVTATVVDAAGTTVFDGTGTAPTLVLEPNGPDCDPRVVQARLRVEDGALVTR